MRETELLLELEKTRKKVTAVSGFQPSSESGKAAKKKVLAELSEKIARLEEEYRQGKQKIEGKIEVEEIYRRAGMELPKE